jgi:hypothetical protein
MEDDMVQRFSKKISSQRNRILPVLVALGLLTGIFVNVLSTPNAVANSYSACSNGYTGIGCPRFVVHKVEGTALVGSTKTLTITGVGFYGRPKITSNEVGAKFGVLHDRGTSLVIAVTVRAGTKHGTYTLTIRLADGKFARIKYVVV